MTEPVASVSLEHLHEQYANPEQQETAAVQGIWVFLATELLLFGALFLGYIVYRRTYPDDFWRAGKDLLLGYGTINTFLLLTSSFTMTLAEEAARLGQKTRLARLLFATALIGVCFMFFKSLEWREDLLKHTVFTQGIQVSDGPVRPPMRLLFFLYWCFTVLHGFHLTIAIIATTIIGTLAHKGKFSREYHTPVKVAGLYWHFVDSVWVVLYPTLYLLGRGGH